MAFLEVVLQQTYAGQEIINRWNYVSGGTPAAVSLSFALVSALGGIYDLVAVPPAYPPDALMRRIAAMQSTGVTFDFLSVKDVYSVTDFFETPFTQPLVGAVAGEALSPSAAIGFRTNRVRTDIRRGFKRITGIPETGSGAAGLVTGAVLTAAQNVGVLMSEVLEYDDSGNTLTFSPVIAGREKYIPDPLRPERVAYRYYPTQAEQLEHVAQGIVWDVQSHTRTQTSRQYGRGR